MGNKNNVRYNPNCAVCQGRGIYTTSNTSGTQSMTRVCDCHIFYDIEKNSQDLGVDDSSQIEKIKKEAYNQALEDAIENATLSLFDWEDGGFKEHKCKYNKFIINDGNYIEVDKESILKLKK